MDMLTEATTIARADAIAPFRLDVNTVSPVMGSFVRSWHDALPPDERDAITPLLPRLADTQGPPELEDRRALIAVDWLIRWYLPNWLAAAGLMGHAMRLTGMPEITRMAEALALKPELQRIASDANAAWVEVRSHAKATVPPGAWEQVREDVRNAVRREMIATGEASVRVPIETLEWGQMNVLVWEAVAACWWTVAWVGVRTIPAASTPARVIAALIPLRDTLKKQAATVVERMSAASDPAFRSADLW